MTEKYEFDYSGENALFTDGKSVIHEVKNGNSVEKTTTDVSVHLSLTEASAEGF